MKVDVNGATLFLSQHGAGSPMLLLSGGPGCPNYLGPVAASLPDWHCLLPDPRGTGNSTGDAHSLGRALDDLEAFREALGLERWTVLGHSWGADLGLAYTLAHPERVQHLVSFAGTGIQNDRDWKAAYEVGKGTEPEFTVAVNDAVKRALLTDWRRFIKGPDLLARLSRLEVPVTFLQPEGDIRPSWPAAQLAALLPQGRWCSLPDAPHNAWLTHASRLTQSLQDVLSG
ncbi:alpha/beta fold hydrolase [Deinococcus altitudinis]|uniref:alpha/beta fold hydrolase n=1 Tax=Deinococcus altitudinis TaxID=468914 RepID=UPI003891328F